MAAALGVRACEICGAEANGAISWVCPRSYLQEVALLAMQRGAERASREGPPLLVAHVPVWVHDDPEEARQAVAQQQFLGFARAPFYVNMFHNAGFPEVLEGTWSEGMVDAVAVWGNEAQVTEGLQGMLAMGATELMASPVAAGADREASLERALTPLAQVSQAVAG